MSRTRVASASAGVLAMVLAAAGYWLTAPTDGENRRPAQASRASASQPTQPSSAPSSRAEHEAADRTAVELAWAKFQDLYPNLVTTHPPDQWPAKVAEVAVDPIRSQVLTAAAQDARTDVTSYGNAIPHPYWQQPIAGKSTAVMRDCLDASRAGSVSKATGHKRTVGIARSSIRVYFVKGGDGSLRVRQIEYHVDEKC